MKERFLATLLQGIPALQMFFNNAMNISNLHDLVVHRDPRVIGQHTRLQKLSVHVPIDAIGRRPAIGIALEPDVLRDAHVLVLGLNLPVGLRLDDNRHGGERHAQLIAAATLVRAHVRELDRRDDELLALAVGHEAAVRGQEAVNLAPEDLRRRTAAEYALEAHGGADQEHSVLFGGPQSGWGLVGWTDLFHLEHGQLALVEEQQATAVRIARVWTLVLFVVVLHIQNVQLAVVVLGDAGRDCDGTCCIVDNIC